MTKCKIYIACHKPCEVPSDSVYTPIHVGRARSKVKLKMIGDDTGDNISQKNNTYCETTGQYWVWKNVSSQDVEYVGFCHYRRFFDYKLTEESVDSLFADSTDVVISSPHFRYNTMQQTLLMYVSSDDVVIVKSVISRLYPEYIPTIEKHLLGVWDYPYNMLICRKEMFDKYAKWIFDILMECEKNIKLSPYSRGRRIFGYIAEFLMPVYFIHNRYKIKHINTVFMSEKGPIVYRTKLKSKIIGFLLELYYKHKDGPYMYDQAHVNALKSDGIDINF